MPQPGPPAPNEEPRQADVEMEEASFFARDGTRVSSWRSSMLPHLSSLLGGIGGLLMIFDLTGLLGSRFALALIWGPLLGGAAVGIVLRCLWVRFR